MKSDYERLFYKMAFSTKNNHYKVNPLPTSDWALVEVYSISKHVKGRKSKYSKGLQSNISVLLLTLSKEQRCRHVWGQRRNKIVTLDHDNFIIIIWIDHLSGFGSVKLQQIGSFASASFCMSIP